MNAAKLKAIEKQPEIVKLKLFAAKDVAEMTSYHLKSIEKFFREGTLKSTLVNGKRVTTMKWIMEWLNSVTDGPKLEF